MSLVALICELLYVGYVLNSRIRMLVTKGMVVIAILMKQITGALVMIAIWTLLMDLAKKRVSRHSIFHSITFLTKMHITPLNLIIYSNFNQFVVCVSIIVVAKYDAEYLYWTLGPCSTSVTYNNGNPIKEPDCCLAPGNHTLTCYNTRKPHGWKQGFIVINGERYCDDFIGYKAMRRVIVNGNISHFETLLLVSS